MKHKFSLNSSKFCLSKTFESPYLCHESGELKVSGICGQGCRDKVAVRLASDTQQQDSKLKNYDNCWKRIRLDSYCRPPASHINIPFIRTSEETLATWHPDKPTEPVFCSGRKVSHFSFIFQLTRGAGYDVAARNL